MELILTIAFGVIGVGGLISTIYFGKKSARLEKARISLSWAEVQLASSDLADSIGATGFVPDIIFAPGARGGIVAESLAHDLNPRSAVLIGITQWKGTGLFEGDLSSYRNFDTAKWRVSVPLALFQNTKANILIVDDLAMSGESLQFIISLLEREGFESNQIRTAVLVATSVAVHNGKGPDFFWKETDSPKFFFPWGKAR